MKRNSRHSTPETRLAEQQRLQAIASDIWEVIEQMLANLDQPETLWCAIGDFKQLTREPPLPQSVQRLCGLADEWIRFKMRVALGQSPPSFADGALEELQLCFKRMTRPAPPTIQPNRKGTTP